MKNTHLFFVLVFVLTALAIPYRAYALGLEAGIGYWKESPSGTISYKAVSPNDTLDLKNDLKLGDSNQVVFRAKIELPAVIPNVYLMATPMSFEGTGSKNVSFTFGNQTFAANVPIQSKLELDQYDLALYYPIPLLGTATLNTLSIDLGLDARQLNFKGTISQNTISLSSSKTSTFYIPMLYLGVQIKPISSFSIEGEGRGVSDGSSHYYDFIGRVKVMPFGPLFISGGYRSEEIKINESDIKTDVKVTGPFIEAGVKF